MAKFTDAWRATLTGYFNAGDQPTEAQFTQLILSIQQGIEEHQHDSTGDGDGTGVLDGPIAIADGNWVGITAGERFFFDAAGFVRLSGADLVIGGAAAPAYRLVIDCEDATDGFQIVNDDTGRLATDGFTFALAALNIYLNNREAGDMQFWTNNTFAATILSNGSVGIGIDAPVGKLHIDQATADAAIPVLILDQADVSEGFINFIGSDRGVITGATNSLESVRVEINGVVRRFAVYADA